jgi:rubrerythrin
MNTEPMPTEVPPPPTSVPVCPVDGMPMTQTIVGWRCPICGATGASRAQMAA